MMIFYVVLFITVAITCIICIESDLTQDTWQYWAIVCSLVVVNYCGMFNGYYLQG